MITDGPVKPSMRGVEVAQDELRAAAAAVVARWDSPKWKDETHTGVFIDRLRKAVAATNPGESA